MRILHVISSVNPKGGGPIEGIKQLHTQDAELNIIRDICSVDAPDSEWVVNSAIKVHALGPAFGRYAYSRKLVPWLRTHAHNYDAVIIDGLWQYTSFAVWRALSGMAIPYYVFTHGMLDPWFKRTYPLKHLKKWLYWPCAEYRVLRDARKVIFTCEEERLLAQESFWLYKANEAVTSYGVTNPPTNSDNLASDFLAVYPHLHNKRIILFLSRIHEKKGCDILIEAFAKIAKCDENLHLVLAGPDQTGWTTKLKAEAEELGISHRISWPGMLHGDMKWGAFYAAEVFCLPSHQENFGIVVAEALACGKPVLISNKVNIWREIIADGAGLVAEDTFEGTVANLNHWLAMSLEEFNAIQAKTRICFTDRFHVRRAATCLLEIIRYNA